MGAHNFPHVLFWLFIGGVSSRLSDYKMQEGAFLLGYVRDQRQPFTSFEQAKHECDNEPLCTGITRETPSGHYTLRSSQDMYKSPSGEITWLKLSGFDAQHQQHQQSNRPSNRGVPSSVNNAVGDLPGLAKLAGLAELAGLAGKFNKPPPSKQETTVIELTNAMTTLENCEGTSHQVRVEHDGSSSMDPNLNKAVQYCMNTECKPSTLAWVWHNFAMKMMRPCKESNVNLYDFNSHILPSQQAEFVRSLFIRSLKEEPDNGEVWLKYANFENSQGDPQKCVEALARGATTVTDHTQQIELYHTLGVHLHDHKMWEQSYFGFQSAIKIADQNPDEKLFSLRFRSACQALYLGHYLADWDYVDALLPTTLAHLQTTLYDANTLPELHPWVSICLPMPPSMRLNIASNFARKLRSHALAPREQGGLGLIPPSIKSPQTLKEEFCGLNCDIPKRRLRVGFASADFKQKATAYLCLSQFKLFNKSKVEVFLYATTPDSGLPSEWRAQLRQEADHFREIDQQVSGAEASQVVANDHLDILIDLDGYSNEGLRKSELFTVRHAPVTMAWFVYMSTLGNPHVDYIIGDSVVLPHSVSKFMTGKVMNMPHSFFPNSQQELFPLDKPFFGINPGLDRSRSEYGLPYRSAPSQSNPQSKTSDAAFVFASFNKHLKISSDLFETWASVLRRLPNSKLLLLRYPKDSEPRIRDRAKKLGVESQLVFVDFVSTSVENFVRLWRCADAVLDTTIYGAHTGTVDALWAGLPVVTCVGNCVGRGGDIPPEHGDQMASRVAASMLHSIGTDELIAADLEEYADIMFKMATDVPWYNALRSRIEASRATGPMWDSQAYSDSLVDGLFQAFYRYLDQKPLAHIFAADHRRGLWT